MPARQRGAARAQQRPRAQRRERPRRRARSAARAAVGRERAQQVLRRPTKDTPQRSVIASSARSAANTAEAAYPRRSLRTRARAAGDHEPIPARHAPSLALGDGRYARPHRPRLVDRARPERRLRGGDPAARAARGGRRPRAARRARSPCTTPRRRPRVRPRCARVLERAGRSLTTADGAPRPGRQAARPRARRLRHAARRARLRATCRCPRSLPPERALPLPAPPISIPIRDRYESRLAFGGARRARRPRPLTGGWIRLREDPGPVDAPLLAAYTDSWPPAIFTRIDPSTLYGRRPDRRPHRPLPRALAGVTSTRATSRSSSSARGWRATASSRRTARCGAGTACCSPSPGSWRCSAELR